MYCFNVTFILIIHIHSYLQATTRLFEHIISIMLQHTVNGFIILASFWLVKGHVTLNSQSETSHMTKKVYISSGMAHFSISSLEEATWPLQRTPRDLLWWKKASQCMMVRGLPGMWWAPTRSGFQEKLPSRSGIPCWRGWVSGLPRGTSWRNLPTWSPQLRGGGGMLHQKISLHKDIKQQPFSGLTKGSFKGHF